MQLVLGLLVIIQLVNAKCWVLEGTELSYKNSDTCVTMNDGINASISNVLELNNNYKQSFITINDYSDDTNVTVRIKSSEQLEYLKNITLNLASINHTFNFDTLKASQLLRIDIDRLNEVTRKRWVYIDVTTDMEVEQKFNETEVMYFYIYDSKYYLLVIAESFLRDSHNWTNIAYYLTKISEMPGKYSCSRKGYNRLIKYLDDNRNRCYCTPQTDENGMIESFDNADCRYLPYLYDLTLISDVNLGNRTIWKSILKDPLTSDTYKVTSDDTIHVENFTVSKSYNLNIQSGIEIKNMSVVSANDHMFLKSFSYDIMKDSMAKNGYMFNRVPTDESRLNNDGFYVYCGIEIYYGKLSSSHECICRYRSTRFEKYNFGVNDD